MFGLKAGQKPTKIKVIGQVKHFEEFFGRSY